MVDQEAMRLVFQEKNPRYSTLPDSQIAVSPELTTQKYIPYIEIARSKYEVAPSSTYNETPALPVEAGYGGGLWTHEEISAEEKDRLDDETGHKRDK
jgi:hypothetical protein